MEIITSSFNQRIDPRLGGGYSCAHASGGGGGCQGRSPCSCHAIHLQIVPCVIDCSPWTICPWNCVLDFFSDPIEKY